MDQFDRDSTIADFKNGVTNLMVRTWGQVHFHNNLSKFRCANWLVAIVYKSLYNKLNSTRILIGSHYDLLEDIRIDDVTINNFCFFIV